MSTVGPKYLWPIALHRSTGVIGKPREWVAPVWTASLIESTHGASSRPVSCVEIAWFRQIARFSGVVLNCARSGSMGRGVRTWSSS